MIYWLVELLIICFINLLISWSINLSMCWSIDLIIYWSTDLLIYWFANKFFCIGQCLCITVLHDILPTPKLDSGSNSHQLILNLVQCLLNAKLTCQIFASNPCSGLPTWRWPACSSPSLQGSRWTDQDGSYDLMDCGKFWIQSVRWKFNASLK